MRYLRSEWYRGCCGCPLGLRVVSLAGVKGGSPVVRVQTSPETPGAGDESVAGVPYVATWEVAEELLGALRETVTAYGYGYLLLRARVRLIAKGGCVLDLGTLHPHAARQWRRLVRLLIADGLAWERAA